MTNVTTSSEQSTAELVNTAAVQVRTLVRDELTLARGELKAKGRRAAAGGGLMTAGVLFGRDALLLLWALIVVALDLVWPLWLAVLVTMLGLLCAAAACAGLGLISLRRATPPVPEKAVDSIATDVQTIRDAAQEGRARS